MVSTWNKSLPPKDLKYSQANQYSAQLYDPEVNLMNFNHREFPEVSQNPHKHLLPDITNTKHSPYYSRSSNPNKPRSRTPIEQRSRNLYEPDQNLADSYHQQPKRRGRIYASSRPDEPNVIQRTFEGPRSRTPIEYHKSDQTSDYMRKHSVSGYDRHNLSVARSADLNGRYSKSPLAKGYVPEADEEIRVLKPIMKKMYGQYLLDQIQSNQGKKYEERRKKIEDDQKFLNEKNFFDRFGRTKGRFFNRFRAKPNQLLEQYSLNYQPSNVYDRDSSSIGIQYNQNHRSNASQQIPVGAENDYNIENDQLSVIPEEPINRGHSSRLSHSRRENSFPLHTRNSRIDNLQQDYSVRPSEPNLNALVTESKFQGDRTNELYVDRDFRMPENPRKSNTQQIGSIRKRAYEKPSPERRVEDDITSNQAVMQFVQKLEYQKSLELQMMEKHFKDSTERKVKILEERIEELMKSRDHIKMELDKKSVSPQTADTNTKNTYVNDSSEYTRRPDRNGLKRYHFSNKKIVPPQEISNNFLSPNRMPTTENSYSNWEGLNHTTNSSPRDVLQYVHLQQEMSKIKDEMRENTQRIQGQIADFKFSNKMHTPNPIVPNIRLSDYRLNIHPSSVNPLKSNESGRSLANESHLVPIQKIETNWNNSNTKGDQVHLGLLLQMANNIENGIKDQNSMLKKELENLKLEIQNLRDKKLEKTEYDDIKMRLTFIADKQNMPSKFINKEKVRLRKTEKGMKRQRKEINTQQKIRHY